MEWYYASNGDKKGPVADEAFRKLVRDGVIRAETLVWRAGMPNWQPYGQVAAAAPTAAAVAGVAPGADNGLEDAESAVCAVSGKRFPKREMIQFEGKWVSAQHRDEFFQRMREGVAQPGEFAAFGYGGFWRRFLARFVDGIVMWVVGMVIGVGVAAAMSAGSSPLALQVAAQLLGTLAGISYEVFFIRKFDATPGKMALGLKVLRSNGESLTVLRIVGRYFANMLSALVLAIGYIIAAFDDEKRALHDHICDTRVVKTR